VLHSLKAFLQSHLGMLLLVRESLNSNIYSNSYRPLETARIIIMLQLGGPGSVPGRSINISEDCGLLDYNTVYFGDSPTFLSSRSPPIRRTLPKSHGGTTQKTVLFLVTVERISNPTQKFLFATASRQALAFTQSSIQGSLPRWVKRQGLEVDHSPPSSAEVKNMWNYTSTPHTSSWHDT
jgi:hypothetical protein